MAGALIDIQIDGSRFAALCAEVEKRAGSMRPAMRLVGEIVTASVRENFMHGGRPEAWKPLAQSTVWGLAGGSAGHTMRGAPRMRADTARRLQNKKVLVRQGMAGGLMGSIHYEEQDEHVLVGSDKPYAAIHQLGGKIPPTMIRPSYKQALYWPDALYPVKKVNRPEVSIPARPFLMVQEEDRPAIHGAIMRWLLHGQG